MTAFIGMNMLCQKEKGLHPTLEHSLSSQKSDTLTGICIEYCALSEFSEMGALWRFYVKHADKKWC